MLLFFTIRLSADVPFCNATGLECLFDSKHALREYQSGNREFQAALRTEYPHDTLSRSDHHRDHKNNIIIIIVIFRETEQCSSANVT